MAIADKEIQQRLKGIRFSTPDIPAVRELLGQPQMKELLKWARQVEEEELGSLLRAQAMEVHRHQGKVVQARWFREAIEGMIEMGKEM